MAANSGHGTCRETRCCLTVLAFLVMLFLPVPATADGRAEVVALLDGYIEVSNRRDREAILALFDRDVSYLDIVRRSRPTLLDWEQFEAEVPLLIEEWNRYSLSFAIEEIRRIEVQGDSAEAVFVLAVNGRWLGVPFARKVLKEFRLIRRGGGWKILDDRGEWLR